MGESRSPVFGARPALPVLAIGGGGLPALHPRPVQRPRNPCPPHAYTAQPLPGPGSRGPAQARTWAAPHTPRTPSPGPIFRVGPAAAYPRPARSPGQLRARRLRPMRSAAARPAGRGGGAAPSCPHRVGPGAREGQAAGGAAGRSRPLSPACGAVAGLGPDSGRSCAERRRRRRPESLPERARSPRPQRRSPGPSAPPAPPGSAGAEPDVGAAARGRA